MKNIVKWFEDENGYGFIEYKDNNVFVYYSIFNEKENKNEYVKFELVRNGKEYKLVNKDM